MVEHGVGPGAGATIEIIVRPHTNWPWEPAAGAPVRLHSLQARAELNDATGKLLWFDQQGGRWVVRLEDFSECVRLKPSNFTLNMEIKLDVAASGMTQVRELYDRVAARLPGSPSLNQVSLWLDGTQLDENLLTRDYGIKAVMSPGIERQPEIVLTARLSAPDSVSKSSESIKGASAQLVAQAISNSPVDVPYAYASACCLRAAELLNGKEGSELAQAIRVLAAAMDGLVRMMKRKTLFNLACILVNELLAGELRTIDTRSSQYDFPCYMAALRFDAATIVTHEMLLCTEGWRLDTLDMVQPGTMLMANLCAPGHGYGDKLCEALCRAGGVTVFMRLLHLEDERFNDTAWIGLNHLAGREMCHDSFVAAGTFEFILERMQSDMVEKVEEAVDFAGQLAEGDGMEKAVHAGVIEILTELMQRSEVSSVLHKVGKRALQNIVDGDAIREQRATDAGADPSWFRSAARICALCECTASQSQGARVMGLKLLKCSRCLRVRYCCKEHQRDHWPVHKHVCTRACGRPTAS